MKLGQIGRQSDTALTFCVRCKIPFTAICLAHRVHGRILASFAGSHY